MDKKQSASSSDFEAKIAELQKIVGRLESDGSVTLEDSMSLFESGLKLTKECVDDLSAMQARIADLNNQLDLILRQPLFGEDDAD